MDYLSLLQVSVDDQNSSPVGLGKNVPSRHMKIHTEGETKLLQMLNLL